MAKTVCSVFKSSLFTSLYLNNFSKYGVSLNVPVRHLYAQTTLGIDNFIQTRNRVKSQFSNMSDKFRTKMTEYVTETENPNIHMIFTEDLKNMVHLAEPNEEDISLVVKMMKKFNQQNKEIRFGSFVFGPVVMRMFYFLNQSDTALECFKTPELLGFFDQLMSYQLLLDLLYENARYDDVMRTFELIKSKQIQNTKYPKNIVVLTMAACYKKNTPESLKYALDLWAELHTVGHLPMRRAATFCAGLCLNQGNPKAALEIISTVRKQNYMTIRNIKAIALADIGRIEDVVQLLKSVIHIDDPNNIKHTFTKDVLERVRIAIEKQSNLELNQEFSRIENILVSEGFITESTIDHQLSSEIVSPPISGNFNNRENQHYQNKTLPRYQQYQGNRTNNYKVFNQRPGLNDMN